MWRRLTDRSSAVYEQTVGETSGRGAIRGHRSTVGTENREQIVFKGAELKLAAESITSLIYHTSCIVEAFKPFV